MSSFLPTIILRHRKENLKKCSLRGLENRDDIHFYTYPLETLPPLTQYVMLHLGHETIEPLSPRDNSQGLFLLDSTWSYEATMHHAIKQSHTLVYRSLPSGFVTAYPRKQTKCIKPGEGLSTLEALYIAYTIVGRDASTLLEHYYWKESFLQKNAFLLSQTSLGCNSLAYKDP